MSTPTKELADPVMMVNEYRGKLEFVVCERYIAICACKMFSGYEMREIDKELKQNVHLPR